ncbi:hypothetical protein [Mycobacterium sp. B14F4]|uniref:hypothetical protein n=1 Tax=Mycobacterium sp. B14F4 TaxID=3153565 RepID=UPI00325FD410
MELLLGFYFCGWAVVSLGLYAAGRRLSDNESPAPHPLWISFLGGAVWPLVLIGFVELSSVVVYTKSQNKAGPGIGILA